MPREALEAIQSADKRAACTSCAKLARSLSRATSDERRGIPPRRIGIRASCVVRADCRLVRPPTRAGHFPRSAVRWNHSPKSRSSAAASNLVALQRRGTVWRLVYSFPMSISPEQLDVHIERLREGNTLTENEVKALCEKVRSFHVFNGSSTSSWLGSLAFSAGSFSVD